MMCFVFVEVFLSKLINYTSYNVQMCDTCAIENHGHHMCMSGNGSL